MTGFVEIPTLEQYCSYCGQRCLHPDIGIITSGSLPDGQAFKGNFYAICFRRTWCGDKRYGCGCYDFTSATVVFKSPGEIIEPAPVGQLPEGQFYILVLSHHYRLQAKLHSTQYH